LTPKALTAQKARVDIRFGKGHIWDLRNGRANLMRPHIQIGISEGKWGIIDYMTYGKADKVLKYAYPVKPASPHGTPYLIEILYSLVNRY
jgi:hypothetical protein